MQTQGSSHMSDSNSYDCLMVVIMAAIKEEAAIAFALEASG